MKSGQTKSGKAFQLTLNEVECFDALRAYLLGLKSLNYMIACKEVAPTTGHVHIHVYAQFMDSVKMSIKKLCGAHVEKCRGSAQQNIAYIKKDGDIIFEHGEPRLKGGYTIKEVENMDAETRKVLPVQMYNIVQKVDAVEKKYISPLDYYKKMEVFYVYGESGAGQESGACTGDRAICHKDSGIRPQTFEIPQNGLFHCARHRTFSAFRFCRSQVCRFYRQARQF